MGTIQQRFEVEQPAASVYDAVARPDDTLKRLPRVISAVRVAGDLYRVMIGPAASAREVGVQRVRNDALRRVEWRTTDDAWSGSVTVERIGPARSAVGVHAESTGVETDAPAASTAHDV